MILGVTIGAQFSRPAFVRVILLVARIASRRRISILSLEGVTRLAFDLLGVGMHSTERKVRLPVVEGLAVDRRNVLAAPLMLRMALLAFFAFLPSAMKTSLRLDVLTDIRMTILTELRLRRLVEPLVALRALLFPFGVPLNDLPGH